MPVQVIYHYNLPWLDYNKKVGWSAYHLGLGLNINGLLYQLVYTFWIQSIIIASIKYIVYLEKKSSH
jgi:hypothetical protein